MTSLPLRTLCVASVLCVFCISNAVGQETIGEIKRNDPAINALLAEDAKIEVLGQGYDWSEGPVWVRDGGFLLFSDVPRNVVFQYREGSAPKPYLMPSGYTSGPPRGNEIGSNGLMINSRGELVLCQHGDRRVAILDSPLKADSIPEPKFRTLAGEYEGKKFNSPNDIAFHSSGAAYFTDPPYGLEFQADDPKREMDYCGVYRVGTDGKITLLTKEMTRPNGIAFSPDEKTLYVAQSDPERPVVMAFDVQDDGTLANNRVLFDAKPLFDEGLPGLPDGMCLDIHGNLFVTGPGGVLIVNPAGKLLGRISTGEATANCTFGDDGSTLYATADMYLVRIKTKTKGDGWE